MTRWIGYVLLAVSACDSGHGNSADAGDASGVIDAAVDAPPDAELLDDCPNRTAPVGMPEGTVPAAEIVAGDVTIRNLLDVQALAGKRVITGNLLVENANFATLALPDLEVVAGSVDITAQAISMLDTVEMPKLETVGSHFAEGAVPTEVTTYRLPRLETLGNYLLIRATEIDLQCLRSTEGTSPTDQLRLVDAANATFSLRKFERGYLELTGMPNLTTLDLPHFTSGSLEIDNMQTLTSISAPMLVSTEFFVMSSAPVLTSITVKAGAALGIVQLLGLPQMTSLSWLSQTTLDSVTVSLLDALTTLTGIPVTGVQYVNLFQNGSLTDMTALAPLQTLQFLQIARNPVLATIVMPNLTATGENIVITANASLNHLDLPVFVMRGTQISEIRNNPMLPTCQAIAIRERVQGSSTSDFEIAGNGTGTCP